MGESYRYSIYKQAKCQKKRREMNDRQSPATLGLNHPLFLPSSSLATTFICKDIKSKSQFAGIFFPAGSINQLREHLNQPAQGFELIIK